MMWPNGHGADGCYCAKLGEMARETGLEPATFGVTGRRSNQLSYSRIGESVSPAKRGVRLEAAARQVKHAEGAG